MDARSMNNPSRQPASSSEAPRNPRGCLIVSGATAIANAAIVLWLFGWC